MASDFESRLKEKIIAYEKKIESRLLQQRYKAIITGLLLTLVACAIVGIIVISQATTRHLAQQVIQSIKKLPNKL